jgi:hypothetical protein
MSSRQAVVLASRVVCVFFLYLGFGSLTNLSLGISNLWRDWHMMHAGSVFQSPGFQVNSLILATCILRLAVELWLAVVFYQCGPRVSGFLAGGVVESEASD